MTQPIKQPNRKGSKNTIQGCHLLTDIYKLYRSKVERGTMYDITERQFRDIVDSVFSAAMEDMLYNQAEINIGSLLGTMYIRKNKTNPERARLNFKIYNETGHRAKHLNLHTKGYYATFIWNKRRSRVANKTWYSFTACRARKRQLSKLFGSGQTDYFTR